MPICRSDETRNNTALRAYSAVYKEAGINIMDLQVALIIAVMAFQRTGRGQPEKEKHNGRQRQEG
jgi:hypothetical protein